MRKVCLILLSALMLSSCASHRLYWWGSYANDDETTRYEELTYQYYNKHTPESLCALLCCYEDMVSHPGGSRGVIPPGICAEYGFLLLQPETMAAFDQHASERQKKTLLNSNLPSDLHQRGILLLQKEMELYPESAIFIRPILEKAK